MTRSTGYIAIDRGIFDHWIAKNEKRFQAWQRMIAEAAYAPKGCRGTWGVVHLERGQLVGSLRIFAEQWGWARSNVDCFLKRLEREGMVCCKKTRTPTRTPTGTYLAHDITIITICNYDEYNKSSTRPKPKPGLQPGLQPGLREAQLSIFVEENNPLTRQPLNLESIVNESMNGQSTVKTSPTQPQRQRYRHLARSRHNNIYIHHNTTEWRAYADDFRSVTGAEPIHDGLGRWFYYLGQAAKPKYRKGEPPTSESKPLAPKRHIG